jgi:hypothetical protein
MSTPMFYATLVLAGGLALSSHTFATSIQTVGQTAIVKTAGSTAWVTFGDVGSLELGLAGSTLRDQGRISAAGPLALTVNGKRVPLPVGAIDLSVDVGSSGPVSAVVTQGTSSTATLTFTRAAGQISVSSSVTNVAGSSVSVSTSTSR